MYVVTVRRIPYVIATNSFACGLAIKTLTGKARIEIGEKSKNP